MQDNEDSNYQESNQQISSQINENDLAPAGGVGEGVANESTPIKWSSSQSVTHQRSKKWHITTALVCVGIILIVVLLKLVGFFDWMSAITTSLLVIVAYSAIMVSSRQPSQVVDYELSDDGLTINGKLHQFSQFRAFGVHQVGGLWQLVLIPTKRLGAEVNIFINEDQGEQIVDMFGSRLPIQEVQESLVDKIIKKLKL